MAVISNGVDPSFARPFPEEVRRRLLARFVLPADSPMLFFVGNHTANKGIDVLIKAAALMRNKASIYIGGAVRAEEQLIKMQRAAGALPSYIKMVFTDFLTREELKAFYEECAAFVFPSRADTLPLVVLEAMACGKAVISTLVGGIPYLVDGDCGVLVPPGDHKALAEAMDYIVAQPTRRSEMGAAARRRASEHFNWRASAESAVELYRQIIPSKFETVREIRTGG